MLTIALCLPRGALGAGGCMTSYNYAGGSVASRHCTTAGDVGWTVPLAHLFTGERVHHVEPWLALTLTAVVLGCLGVLVLWVAVARHLRGTGWSDLERVNPAAVSWATSEQTGGPSTTRPATTRPATMRPASGDRRSC